MKNIKLHLFFLNLLAFFLIIIGWALAFSDAHDFTLDKLQMMNRAGVVDMTKMIAYARAHDYKKVSHKMIKDDYYLVNWLTTYRLMRNYIAYPCAVIVLLNAAVILKLYIIDVQKASFVNAARDS